MNFEWDKAKNRSNIRKHGLDFADAEEMFRGEIIVEPDTREDYGEKRWRGIGVIRGRTAAIRGRRCPAGRRAVPVRRRRGELAAGQRRPPAVGPR